jgi:hypothetical protein
MTREHLEKVVGAVLFVSFIAAHFLFGVTIAVKVLGVGCLFSGALWSIERSVPVGIEGRPPSFFLRGIGALLAGLVMGALGVFLLLYSSQAACMLGWTSGVTCQ